MRHETEIDTILKQVDPWPTEERVALAYRILRDMRKNYLQPAPRATLHEALGVAAGSTNPPDDDTVRKWTDDHRIEKHG